jgi:hypothetical protein
MAEVCKFCEQSVTVTDLGVYRYISGWAQVRAQGGSNSLAMTSEPHYWAHGPCIQKEKQKRSGEYSQIEVLF